MEKRKQKRMWKHAFMLDAIANTTFDKISA